MTHANDLIDVYNGCNSYYSHWLKPFVFTDGVKKLADACECYWLLDVILSHQLDHKVKAQPFQVWLLKRLEGSKFVVDLEDGNDTRLLKQVIPYSDFPHDSATLWLIDGCLLLPAEY